MVLRHPEPFLNVKERMEDLLWENYSHQNQ